MKPWYKDGLRFKCTGCGQCCTGSPGYVWVSDEEAVAIAERLKITVEEFIKKYTRRVGNRLSLKERLVNKQYDCVFLDGKRCTIYEQRPKQCRTYPWWKENVGSPESWTEEGVRCEGINHPDAPLISLQEIQKHLPDPKKES
ncbi:MAG: YkgJ family cysteine cluster protein [Verrucomicrobia bacterium]|nr:YkgJ family cysteine cluster protein [Verrucomicrobiota bacterium]